MTDNWATQNEHWRNNLDSWKAHQEARKPLIEAGVRYAELAIKSLLIISGGSAVALAGFAGGALKSDAEPIVLQAVSASVWWFALAAASAVLTAGVAYLSQSFILDVSEPWGGRIGVGLRWAAVLLFVLGLACFIVGAHHASTALNPKQVPAVTTTNK
jgi:hypothetical protein